MRTFSDTPDRHAVGAVDLRLKADDHVAVPDGGQEFRAAAGRV